MITISLIALIAIYLAGFFLLPKDEESQPPYLMASAGNWLVSLFLGCTIFYGCAFSDGKDNEYWGSYVTQAVFEEEWNEYIHQTCSYTTTDSEGNTTTHYYDCSYVQYHPERWWFQDNIGQTFNISEAKYNELVKRWHSQKKTGHHSGHTISGDIFSTFYDNNRDHMECITTVHPYFNRVDASDSVFKFTPITPDNAKKLGLYDYPAYSIHIPSVFGYKNSHNLDVLNSLYGNAYQVRVWILVYKDLPAITSVNQRDYWHGSNKNELVLCIGLKDNKVEWANTFSWSESDELLVDCREEILKQHGKTLEIESIVNYLHQEIPTRWQRKQFADFNYLSLKVNTGWYITAIVVSFIAGLIGPGYVLFMFHAKDKKNELRPFHYSRFRR